MLASSAPLAVVNAVAKVLADSFQNIAVFASAPPLRFMINPTSMLAAVDPLFKTVIGSLIVVITVLICAADGLVNGMRDSSLFLVFIKKIGPGGPISFMCVSLVFTDNYFDNT